MSQAVAASQTASAPVPQNAAQPATKSGESGFSFHDFLNIINPLQHIPVVATLYREITGDTIKPISNILGGALFGGVIGLASAAVDSIVQEVTGEDIGGHVMATLGLHHDSPSDSASAHQVASAPAKPVPAFLVAEAAADRSAHASTAPVGTLQPTDFWRSLQRGGSGVTHGSSGRPVITIGPPRPLTNGAQAPAAAAQPSASPQPILKPASDGTATITSSSAIRAPAANTAAAAQPTAAAMSAGIQPLPKAQIPEMMMQALAKYEAMHKAPQAQVVDQVN